METIRYSDPGGWDFLKNYERKAMRRVKNAPCDVHLDSETLNETDRKETIESESEVIRQTETRDGASCSQEAMVI